MVERRVVVTGCGALSCVGNNVAEFWDALVNGRCGLGPVTRFDTTDFRTKIAGEIKNFDVSSVMKSEISSLGFANDWNTSVSVPSTILTAAISMGSAVLIYLSVASKSNITNVLF